MSYAAISTRNESGVKRLPGLSGQIHFLSGLGDDTETNFANLKSAGVDADLASSLLGLGATQEDINTIVNDPDSQAMAEAMYIELASRIPNSPPSTLPSTPPESQPVNTQPPAQTPPSGAIPAGATYVYNATYNSGGDLLTTTKDVINRIGLWLSTNRKDIQITGAQAGGFTLTAPSTLTLTLHSNTSFASADHLQSIIDHALNDVHGGLMSSNISVVSGGSNGSTISTAPPSGVPGSGVAPAPTTAIGFLEEKWPWIAGIVVVGIIGVPLIKKLL